MKGTAKKGKEEAVSIKSLRSIKVIFQKKR